MTSRVSSIPCHPPVMHQHVICRHQVEVEINPASGTVYFSDERYVNPVNTQLRFSANVYNAKNSNVTWQVVDMYGNPGAGTIDPSGLYQAPVKGGLLHGHTELVIATARADPTRRAFAKVTLVGVGPEEKPHPRLEVYPQLAQLYYQGGSGVYNQYIDTSNKRQQFRALTRHTTSSAVTWSITGPGTISPDGLYTAPASGTTAAVVHVHAQLNEDSSVKRDARIILLNYFWPGIVD